jgi:hypothetical protein
MASADGRWLMTNRPIEPVAPVEQEQLQQARGTSRLEQRACQAAASHCLGAGSGTERDFLKRLSKQEQRLRAAFQYFRQSSGGELTLSAPPNGCG